MLRTATKVPCYEATPGAPVTCDLHIQSTSHSSTDPVTCYTCSLLSFSSQVTRSGSVSSSRPNAIRVKRSSGIPAAKLARPRPHEQKVRIFSVLVDFCKHKLLFFRVWVSLHVFCAGKLCCARDWCGCISAARSNTSKSPLFDV